MATISASGNFGPISGGQDNFDNDVTVANANSVLVVMVNSARSGDTCNSATFNGDSLTEIQSEVTGTDRNLSIWYLLNPDTGTHTLSTNVSSTHRYSVSYAVVEGLELQAPTDSDRGEPGSSTSVTGTVDVAALSWVMMANFNAYTASTNSTLIPSTNNGDDCQMFYADGVTAQSNFQMTQVTGGGSAPMGFIIAAFSELQSAFEIDVFDSISVVDVFGYYQELLVIEEWVNATLVHNPQGVDTVSVAEDIQRHITIGQSVFDTVSITEDVSVLLISHEALIDVNDTISVTENIQRELTSFISVFDTVSVAESVTMHLTSAISVFDALTVTESVNVEQRHHVSVFDALTVAEDVQRSVSGAISVFDTVSVTENVARTLSSDISVFDTVSITEAVTLHLQGTVSVFDAITVTDEAQLLFIDADVLIFVSDNVSVAENIQTFLPLLTTSVFETITINESVDPETNNIISVFDAVTVTDVPVVEVVNLVSVFDTLTVTESVTRTLTNNISVFDAISITENVSMEPVVSMSVFDSISLAESISTHVTGDLSVFDSVSVGEDASLEVNSAVGVFDALSVAESVTVESFNNISVFDALTVAEDVVRGLFFTIEINDTVFVDEAIQNEVLGTISVFDPISVLDVPENELFLNINQVDTLSVLEDIQSESIRFTPQIPSARPRFMPGTGPQRFQGSGGISQRPFASGGAK